MNDYKKRCKGVVPMVPLIQQAAAPHMDDDDDDDDGEDDEN